MTSQPPVFKMSVGSSSEPTPAEDIAVQIRAKEYDLAYLERQLSAWTARSDRLRADSQFCTFGFLASIGVALGINTAEEPLPRWARVLGATLPMAGLGMFLYGRDRADAASEASSEVHRLRVRSDSIHGEIRRLMQRVPTTTTSST